MHMHKTLTGSLLLALLAILVFADADAAEISIGQPIKKYGMQIGAVYLQPVLMDPKMPGAQLTADIHLEADVHADNNNPHGFDDGAWIPYLDITYHLEKVNGNWSTNGSFMPMVASDGPHYGDNVKLNGPGKYRLSYYFKPPAYNSFYRHTDKETKVAPWWQPFTLSWEFSYVGTGKKGGY